MAEYSNLGVTRLLKTSFSLIYRFAVDNAEVILFLSIIFYKVVLFNRSINLNSATDLFVQTSTGAALVLLSLGLLFRRRMRVTLLFFMNIAVTIVIISDLIYFRYFNDVISAPVLSQIILVKSVKNSILSLIRLEDLLFFIDIIVVIPILLYYFSKRSRYGEDTAKTRILKASVVFVLGIILLGQGFYKVNRLQDDRLFSYVFDHTYFVENLGLINYHGFDAYYSTINKLLKKSSIDEAEKKAIKDSFDKSNQKSESFLKGYAEGCNLILVQVEALQNTVIGMEVEGREVTPNLNRLIKRSMYFNNYYSQTVKGSTSDAEFMSNVSYYPLRDGAVYFKYSNNTFESLPWALKDKGYDTFVMHAYKPSFWNRSSIYPVLGFERFFSAADYMLDEKIGWGLSDESFLSQSAGKLSEVDNPFYSFIITLSSHHPYDAFKDSKDISVGQYENTFYGSYLKAIHYTDKALGVFINELEEYGLMDKSLLVIYGDHAAIQKEKMSDFKLHLNSVIDKELAWFEMLKVPLVMHFPGDGQAGVITAAGGQVDLFPTIANLMNLEPKYCMGRDLLNSDSSFVIFRDGSITDGNTIYLKNYDSAYELKSGKRLHENLLAKLVNIAEEKLKISDKVLEHDLVRYFEESPKR